MLPSVHGRECVMASGWRLAPGQPGPLCVLLMLSRSLELS